MSQCVPPAQPPYHKPATMASSQHSSPKSPCLTELCPFEGFCSRHNQLSACSHCDRILWHKSTLWFAGREGAHLWASYVNAALFVVRPASHNPSRSCVGDSALPTQRPARLERASKGRDANADHSKLLVIRPEPTHVPVQGSRDGSVIGNYNSNANPRVCPTHRGRPNFLPLSIPIVAFVSVQRRLRAASKQSGHGDPRLG
jgi:hypothetical protein